MKNILLKAILIFTFGAVAVTGWGQTYYPIKGATNVSTTPILTITFSVNQVLTYGDVGGGFFIQKDNGNGTYTDIETLSTGDSEGGILVDSRLTINGNALTIDLSNSTKIEGNTTYRVYCTRTTAPSILVDGAAWAALRIAPYWTFTTAASPPAWVGNISLTNQTSSNITLNGTVNQSGNFYYVVTTDVTIPTATQIQAGQDGTGASAALSGSNTCTANVAFAQNITISSLTTGTYFVYVVAKNATSQVSTVQTAAPAFAVDNSAPVGTFTPANNSFGVDIASNIVLTFNEAVRMVGGTTLDNTNVGSLVSFNNSVAFTATISSDKKTITINPDVDLIPGTDYDVTVAKVEDLKGNAQLSDNRVSFRTNKTFIWTGGSSTLWTDNGNWDSPIIANCDVVIPAGCARYPVISGNTDVNNMTVDASADVTVSSGYTLSIKGNLTMGGSSTKNASLVMLGNVNVLGTSTFNQPISSSTRSYYISSPVSNATKVSIGTTGELYRRDAATASWVAATNLTSGEGYLTRTTTSSLTFSGALNNANSYTFSTVRTSSPNNYGWNLAGNPYPSSINWDLVNASDRTGLNNSFWIWKNESSVWGVYNGAVGDGVNVASIGESLIPSGHSFYVQVNINETSGSLVFRKAQCVANTYTYLKTAGVQNKAILRFEGVNGTKVDETAIIMADGASDSYDAFDSEKFLSSSTDIVDVFTVVDGTKCAINSYDLNSFSGSKVIPMGYNAKKTGNFEIKLKSIEGLSDAVSVSIEDTKTGVIQPLSANSIFSFAAELKTDLTRFKIHLSSIATDVDTPLSVKDDVNIYCESHQLYVKIGTLTDSYYNLYDMTGRLVGSGELLPDGINKVTTPKDGLYVLKVIANETTISRKVLIN